MDKSAPLLHNTADDITRVDYGFNSSKGLLASLRQNPLSKIIFINKSPEPDNKSPNLKCAFGTYAYAGFEISRAFGTLLMGGRLELDGTKQGFPMHDILVQISNLAAGPESSDSDDSDDDIPLSKLRIK